MLKPALRLLAAGLLALACACRGPLARIGKAPGDRVTLDVPRVEIEDHSRVLKRLREVAPGEANTPEARRAALEDHRRYLDANLRQRAADEGWVIDPGSPWRLELRVTTLGEVRARYIAYGILSGVAWGVGTGLATHSTKLALGLGGYELVEESIFWIAGSSLFGRFSAPVVLEAALLEKGRPRPLWTETYCVIWGGARLKAYPPRQRKDRKIQLQASLERALDKLFEDMREGPRQPPSETAN